MLYAPQLSLFPDRETPWCGKSTSGSFVDRTGLMDEYIAEMLQVGLSGIPVDDWIRFFRRFRQ